MGREGGDFIQGLDAETEWFQSEDITGDDMLSVFTTSGSTGFSKLVAHSHDSFIKIFRCTHDFIDTLQEPVSLNTAPLGWTGGSLPFTLIPGTTRVLLDVRAGIPDDVVDFLWRSVQEERCHLAYSRPCTCRLWLNWLQPREEEKVPRVLGSQAHGR